MSFAPCNLLSPLFKIRMLLIGLWVCLPVSGQNLFAQGGLTSGLRGWWGEATGEFTRRYIQNDLTYFRRLSLLLGRTEGSQWSFWVEGGLVSLQLLSSGEPKGDWGPSVYLGWTFRYPKPWLWSPDLFVSARAGFNQSKLAHDTYRGSILLTSRRSRFEWWEGWGVVGGKGTLKAWRWSGGIVLRNMVLDEFRSLRAGSAPPQKTPFTYRSGFQPGVGLGVEYPLSQGWTISLWGEAFSGPSGRFVVGVREWRRY